MSLIRARYRAVNTIMNLPRGGYTPSAEVAAYLAKLTAEGFALPSVANQQLLDTFVASLKSAGAWASLDVIQMWAQDSNSVNAGRVNLKNPSDSLATLYNAVTFTNKVGIAGDGVSAYVDTGYAPSTYGGNYADNDAMIGAYVFQQSTSSSAEFISNSGVGGSLRLRNSNSAVQRINTTSNLSSNVNFATTGFLAIHKTSALNVVAQVNTTTSANTYPFDGTTVASGNVVLFAQTGLAAYVNSGIGLFMLGGEQSTLTTEISNAVNAYITGVAAL